MSTSTIKDQRIHNIMFEDGMKQLPESLDKVDEEKIAHFIKNFLTALKEKETVQHMDTITEFQLYLRELNPEKNWNKTKEMYQTLTEKTLGEVLGVSPESVQLEYLEKILSHCVLREDYKTTEAVSYFLENNENNTYADLRNTEQRRFMEMIQIYPENNRGDLYTLLRTFVITGGVNKSNKINPYIQEKTFEELKEEAKKVTGKDIKLLIEMFKYQMFEKVALQKNMRVCTNCGDITEDFESFDNCDKFDCCSHAYRKRLARKEFVEKNGEEVYILKEGVHKYIRIPGLEEVRVYNYLKNKLSKSSALYVVMYPGMEKYGDVAVYDNQNKLVLSIDLKDYASPKMLIEKYADETFKSHMLYIPEYRMKEFGYLNRLKNSSVFKDIEIGSTQLLGKIVEEKMKKYELNN